MSRAGLSLSSDEDVSDCSLLPAAKEKGEKKLFGFAFACLMDAEGATIRDGSHELCVYKCDDRHKLLVGVIISAASFRQKIVLVHLVSEKLGRFLSENCPK